MNKVNFQEAIVYEIHPQSFYDSNNDGIGDWNGKGFLDKFYVE
ncbi:hypothetical protein [Spiroplasma endosymbiont of Stenodema calcarata]